MFDTDNARGYVENVFLRDGGSLTEKEMEVIWNCCTAFCECDLSNSICLIFDVALFYIENALESEVSRGENEDDSLEHRVQTIVEKLIARKAAVSSVEQEAYHILESSFLGKGIPSGILEDALFRCNFDPIAAIDCVSRESGRTSCKVLNGKSNVTYADIAKRADLIRNEDIAEAKAIVVSTLEDSNSLFTTSAIDNALITTDYNPFRAIAVLLDERSKLPKSATNMPISSSNPVSTYTTVNALRERDDPTQNQFVEVQRCRQLKSSISALTTSSNLGTSHDKDRFRSLEKMRAMWYERFVKENRIMTTELKNAGAAKFSAESRYASSIAGFYARRGAEARQRKRIAENMAAMYNLRICNSDSFGVHVDAFTGDFTFTGWETETRGGSGDEQRQQDIDLHGISVYAALSFVESVLEYFRSRTCSRTNGDHHQRLVAALKHRSGVEHVKFIVGKGLHSHGGVARLRPAITTLLKKCGFNIVIGEADIRVLL